MRFLGALLILFAVQSARAQNLFGAIYDTYSAKFYGVTGDGSTDDTAALNAMFSTVPDFSEIIFAPGMKMKITGTITIQSKSGLKIRGMIGHADAANPGYANPQFMWYGPNGGTMFYINKVNGLVMEGLAFYSKPVCNSTAMNVANIGIDLDQSSANPGGITTRNVYNNLIFNFCGTPVNDSWIGMRISNVSLSNVENITIEDSKFYCPGNAHDNAHGIGIEWGVSANTKNQVINNSHFSGCNNGLHLKNGMVAVHNGSFQSNNIAIQADNIIDNLAVDDVDFENNNQVLVSATADPIVMSRNRFAASYIPSGHALIEVNHGPLTLIGNKFSSITEKYLICTNECSLFSSGNRYYDNTLARLGWDTFQGNVISIQDKLTDPSNSGTKATGITMGGNTLYGEDNAYAYPIGLAGLGSLFYDSNTKHWSVIEDAGVKMRLSRQFVQSATPTCTNIGDTWLDTTTTTTAMKVCLNVSGSLSWVTK